MPHFCAACHRAHRPQDIGVKTDTNGYLTEAGLVAFYREFGHLADDVEATGVSFFIAFNSLTSKKYTVL